MQVGCTVYVCLDHDHVIEFPFDCFGIPALCVDSVLVDCCHSCPNGKSSKQSKTTDTHCAIRGGSGGGRETDRDRQRQTDRDRQTETDRQTDRHRERERERERNRDRQTDRQRQRELDFANYNTQVQ